jgi:hypothetical protein
MVQYLFNSTGDWIAFRDGDFIFDPYAVARVML